MTVVRITGAFSLKLFWERRQKMIDLRRQVIMCKVKPPTFVQESVYHVHGKFDHTGNYTTHRRRIANALKTIQHANMLLLGINHKTFPWNCIYYSKLYIVALHDGGFGPTHCWSISWQVLWHSTRNRRVAFSFQVWPTRRIICNRRSRPSLWNTSQFD